VMRAGSLAAEYNLPSPWPSVTIPAGGKDVEEAESDTPS
jgi:hypothetical protein